MMQLTVDWFWGLSGLIRPVQDFYLLNVLAIDFPGGKRNRNMKIRAQLRILKCIAIVKEATRKVLKR